MKGYDVELPHYRNHTISLFRKFGDQRKELQTSKNIQSEKEYKKTIQKLSRELIDAKKNLEHLQMKQLIFNNTGDSSNRARDTVTREELEDASIRLTLAKKVIEQFDMNKSNINLLIG